jgi:hypothetical protein
MWASTRLTGARRAQQDDYERGRERDLAERRGGAEILRAGGEGDQGRAEEGDD